MTGRWWRHRAPAFVVALVLAVLAGCAAIPTAGPIGTGDVVLTEPGEPFPLANDPPQDGSLEAVVQGFLLAGAAGLADQYVVARKYLTVMASTRWDPTARLVVYPARSQPAVVTVDERAGTAVVSIEVQGSVDAAGVYSEAPPGAREDLTFDLIRDLDDQWRIAALPDVVVMSSIFFTAFYRQAPLYFPSTDGTHLVPDLRWFPATGTANSAIRALLAGPAPWLRDAVQVVAPEGTRLSVSGVTESGDLAQVDLTSPAAAAATAQRNLLVAQIAETLVHLPGSTTSQVVVTAGGGEPWVLDGATLVRDPQPDTGPYLIADGRLQLLGEDGPAPVDGLADLPPTARAPALSADGQLAVVVDAGQSLLRLSQTEAALPLLSGAALVDPSIDRFGWIWTADRDAGTGLTAVSADGEVAQVTADWLAGVSVVSLAVARDGSRIAVAHTGPGDQHVVIDVATVLRDDAGRPQRLGDGVPVGQSMTSVVQVEWMDEATIAALGGSGTLVAPTMHLVPVGGQTASLSVVDGTRTIVAGRGARALYVADETGTLFWRQGGAWVSVATGVLDPVFPG